MFGSSNPTMKKGTFNPAMVGQETMTIAGVTNKSMILFMLMMMTFVYSWNYAMPALQAGVPSQAGTGMMFAGGIGGFILALVTIFKKEWSPVTAPLYALCEGLLLGAISAIYNYKFQGIVFNAVTLTFGIFFSLLLVYRWGLIRATDKFKKIMMVSMMGIMIVYLASFILSFFSISIPFIHGSGMIGIGFSLFVVGIAAFSLILDFDQIEQGIQARAPKYMEWYSGFSLLVTLIWLYMEILRLLSKLNSRD